MTGNVCSTQKDEANKFGKNFCLCGFTSGPSADPVFVSRGIRLTPLRRTKDVVPGKFIRSRICSNNRWMNQPVHGCGWPICQKALRFSRMRGITTEPDVGYQICLRQDRQPTLLPAGIGPAVIPGLDLSRVLAFKYIVPVFQFVVVTTETP